MLGRGFIEKVDLDSFVGGGGALQLSATRQKVKNFFNHEKVPDLNQKRGAILAMSQLSIVFNRVTRVTELPELRSYQS